MANCGGAALAVGGERRWRHVDCVRGPTSSVPVAVELLLSEWKPRSLAPVTAAGVAASVVLLMGSIALSGAGVFIPHLLWLDAAVIAGLASGPSRNPSISRTIGAAACPSTAHAGRLWRPRRAPRGPGRWLWAIRPSGRRMRAAWGDLCLSPLSGDVCHLGAVARIGRVGRRAGALVRMGGALGTALSPLVPGHQPALWATVGMDALLGATRCSLMRPPFFHGDHSRL